MTAEEVERAYEIFSKGHNTITLVGGDDGCFDSDRIGIEEYVSIAKGYIAAFDIITDLKEKLEKTVRIAELQNAVIKLNNTINEEAD